VESEILLIEVLPTDIWSSLADGQESPAPVVTVFPGPTPALGLRSIGAAGK
jgi:hypothetical protein